MAPKPKVLLYDNPDDRKEITYLLSKLSPARRLAFLRWACARSTMPNTPHHPIASPKTAEVAEKARWDSSADSRLTVEVYMDIFNLSMAYGLDLDEATKKLVEMVRLPQSSNCIGSTESSWRG